MKPKNFETGAKICAVQNYRRNYLKESDKMIVFIKRIQNAWFRYRSIWINLHPFVFQRVQINSKLLPFYIYKFFFFQFSGLPLMLKSFQDTFDQIQIAVLPF